MFKSILRRNDAETKQEIYIIENLSEPLLGRPAIQALNLIERINKLEETSCKTKIKKQYPELFTGLGLIKDKKYTIRLKENVTPFSVPTPRRIPFPHYKKVQEELKRLEKLDIIKPVSKPTEWCSPIVVVPKQNDNVRICVDLTKLNQGVKRENFPLPCTEQLLSQLSQQTIWSKLDCNAGFHQLALDENSQELTTFITPFERYCYKRLCFGISSGPEIFQREMSQLLKDIPGVVCAIDDILIGGATQEEHDMRLHEVLERLKNAGVTLNEKCEFNQKKIKFLGHIISNEGIQIDPSKKKAITNFPKPENITELRRFLGMINHVSKFYKNIADKTVPLRDLLKSDNEWIWDVAQQEAFEKLKKDLTESPILIHYDSRRETKVTTDASNVGLGAVLYQKEKELWKPVFYASRSLTSTEQRYPQVEKEALGVTWGCEKFSDYLIGLKMFQVETDHKPLLALLQTKRLDELTPRIQRFRMRLMRYSYIVKYTKGKDLHAADALSRAPLLNEEDKENCLGEQEVDAYVKFVIDNLPASDGKLDEIKIRQDEDEILKKVKQLCLNGWSSTYKQNEYIKSFFAVRNELAVHENLLMFQNRIVIPKQMQREIMTKLHESHLGIVKCRALAKESVWWPGISADIEREVKNCKVCEKYRILPPEPLVPSTAPDYPWQKLAMDLFEWKGLSYLIVVDYFSRWIEMAFLKTTTTVSTIEHIKSMFAKYGIPEYVISDNGPQFSSYEFQKFSKAYGFKHTTSSPRYPQGNGEAERAVRTLKNLLKQAADPYLALWNYRATPLEHGLSPAELLQGRKLRTKIPSIKENFKPSQDNRHFFEKDAKIKARQKKNFDRAHKARPLVVMEKNQSVWVNNPKMEPGIIHSGPSSRSYLVRTSSNEIQRRNRKHLRHRDDIQETKSMQFSSPGPAMSNIFPRDRERNFHTTTYGGKSKTQSTLPSSEFSNSEPPSIVASSTPRLQNNTYVTRSGRTVKAPKRYTE